jgi:predicted patatin/cPLA2 family phospholipase
MKRGLVLEGGAMRGMFTAGVTDVLMEHGIEFDGAVGVSAGAAFGCNYKSRQIGRVIRYNTRFCKDKRYGGIGVLLKTGDIYSKDFAYNEVPLKHDIFDFDTYENNPMEFYVVCTDVESGKAFYHKYEGKNDHGFEWIRASSSMPMVSNIVEIDGKKFLDGGISDPIPLKFFESIGYEKNIVILTRPANYIKGKSKFMSLFKLKYKSFPFFIETMLKRPDVYNSTLKYIRQKEKLGEVLVIRPPAPLPVSRTEKDPDKLREAYNIGRKTALSRIDEIKKFLIS